MYIYIYICIYIYIYIYTLESAGALEKILSQRRSIKPGVCHLNKRTLTRALICRRNALHSHRHKSRAAGRLHTACAYWWLRDTLRHRKVSCRTSDWSDRIEGACPSELRARSVRYSFEHFCVLCGGLNIERDGSTSLHAMHAVKSARQLQFWKGHFL